MNKYNPNIHHRRSIRLRGYDYAQPGAYFITIVVQNRACLFGHVADGKMVLNHAGKMIEKWYFELPNKFPDIQCDQHIIMPNHMHFIVINVGADLRVCPYCPNKPNEHVGSPKQCEMNEHIIGGEHGNRGEHDNWGEHTNWDEHGNRGEHDNRGEHTNGGEHDNRGEHGNRGEHINRGEHTNGGEHDNRGEHGNRGEHVGSPLRDIVRWFKTMTTNEYIRNVKNNGWKPFDGKLWQRNYYEHIVLNDDELNAIRQYIINNPSKWPSDKIFMK